MTSCGRDRAALTFELRDGTKNLPSISMRRERDSNPRDGLPAYTLSRRTSSATRAPLRIMKDPGITRIKTWDGGAHWPAGNWLLAVSRKDTDTSRKNCKND